MVHEWHGGASLHLSLDGQRSFVGIESGTVLEDPPRYEIPLKPLLGAAALNGLLQWEEQEEGAEPPPQLGRDEQRALERQRVYAWHETLTEVLRALPDHAICVLGDLNDTSDSMPVRIVRGAFESEAGALFACADGLPLERRLSCFHGGVPALIDHVLVSSRPFRAVNDFAIQNERLRWHGPYVEGEVALSVDSDHALCVVELG